MSYRKEETEDKGMKLRRKGGRKEERKNAIGKKGSEGAKEMMEEMRDNIVKKKEGLGQTDRQTERYYIPTLRLP